MLIRSDQIAEVQLEKQRREVQVYNYLLKKQVYNYSPTSTCNLACKNKQMKASSQGKRTALVAPPCMPKFYR